MSGKSDANLIEMVFYTGDFKITCSLSLLVIFCLFSKGSLEIWMLFILEKFQLFETKSMIKNFVIVQSLLVGVF